MAKREAGYVLDVKLFVPVNPKSPADTIAKAQAVAAAQSDNDLSGLVGQSDIMSVKHRWTSREAAEDAVVHTPAETVAEIAEQAQQKDIEEFIDQPKTEPVETQETGPGSVGEEQQDATEEAATGTRKSRRTAA